MSGKSLQELEELVGETKETVTEFTVEAGKVEEFARAVKDDDPVHRDEDAAAERGFEAVPAPLTYQRVGRFPRYRPDLEHHLGFDFGFDRSRVVHGEQEYYFERPLQVGDTLTGTTTVTDVYERDGSRGGTMTFVILETAYRDRAGELVQRVEHTVIETGKAIDDEGGPAE